MSWRQKKYTCVALILAAAVAHAAMATWGPKDNVDAVSWACFGWLVASAVETFKFKQGAK